MRPLVLYSALSLPAPHRLGRARSPRVAARGRPTTQRRPRASAGRSPRHHTDDTQTRDSQLASPTPSPSRASQSPRYARASPRGGCTILRAREGGWALRGSGSQAALVERAAKACATMGRLRPHSAAAEKPSRQAETDGRREKAPSVHATWRRRSPTAALSPEVCARPPPASTSPPRGVTTLLLTVHHAVRR